MIHAWALPVLAGDAFLTPALDPTPVEDEARRTLDTPCPVLVAR